MFLSLNIKLVIKDMDNKEIGERKRESIVRKWIFILKNYGKKQYNNGKEKKKRNLQ